MSDFERGAALILAKLYESFPVPANVRISEIEREANGELQRTHCATFEFLTIEGYVRYTGATGPHMRGHSWHNVFRGAVLSAKGLAVLNAIPSPLSGFSDMQEKAASISRGRQLVAALADQNVELACCLVREVISAQQA